MRQIFAEKLQTFKGPVADNWFFILLVLFIIGFFITPERSYHRNGYYLLLFLPALIIFFRDRSIRNLTKEIPFYLIFIFLFYCAFSLSWSENRTLAELYDVSRYFLLVLSFPLIIVLAFRSEKTKVNDFLWYMFIAISITSFIAILIYYSNNNFPAERLRGLSPYTYYRNTGANIYGIFAVVGFSFLFCHKKRAQLSLQSYITTIICTFFICFYIMLTQTRGALLALTITLCILLILNKHYKKLIFVLIIALFSIAFIEFSDSMRGFIERGFGARPLLWLDAFHIISQKPFFGHGIATYILLDGGTNEYGRSHNIVFYILIHYGIIGFFLFSWLTILMLWESIKAANRFKDWTLPLMLTYGILTMMFAEELLLSSPNAAWILYWMPIALILATKYSIIPEKK